MNERPFVSILLLCAVLFILIFTGIQGVDFGYHEDEYKHIRPLAQSLNNRIFLPNRYIHPSMCYDIAIIVLLPDIIKLLPSFLRNDRASLGQLKEIVLGHSFLLKLRVICIILCSLSILWVYLLILSWRKNPAEALLGACFLGFSWQVAYHSRWVAPDAIMMQFGALSMMLVFFALDSSVGKIWLRLAAVSAGLAFGTKYQGCLFIIPVLLAASHVFKNRSWKARLALCSKLFFLMVLIYLATTPGTFLEPVRFYENVMTDWNGYASGGGNNTVRPGIEHIILMVQYFSLVLFSKYAIIACFVFFFTAVGLFAVVKEDKERALIFLSLPFLYLAFMATRKGMVIRNLMILAPFLAILAARGFTYLQENVLKHVILRATFATLVAVALFINGYWLYWASESIKNKQTDNYIAQLTSYIDRYPNKKFLVSKDVHKALLSFNAKEKANVTEKYSDEIDTAVLYKHELISNRWPATIPNYLRWFGAYEIDVNYSRNCSANDKILLAPADWAVKRSGAFAKNKKS